MRGPFRLRSYVGPGVVSGGLLAFSRSISSRSAARALGPSCATYLNITKTLGARASLFDEVWAINAMGDVIACDRVFHMDDVRVQEMRTKHRTELRGQAFAKTTSDTALLEGEIAEAEAALDQAVNACLDAPSRNSATGITEAAGRLEHLRRGLGEVQQIRGHLDAQLKGPPDNIGAMLPWLRRHPGPVYTSVPHPDYPGMVAYPLQEVMNDIPFGYFNSTVAYAVALAIHEKVETLHLFGVDFSYANAHGAEQGRACVEFWLGLAIHRGIFVQTAVDTPLLDSNVPKARRFYGYDLAVIRQTGVKAGEIQIDVSDLPQEQWPSAEEIEDRYDHSKHPQEDHPAGTVPA